jgi:anti-anti-sigma factor
MAEVNQTGANGSAVAAVDANGQTVVTVEGEFDVSNVDTELRPVLQAIDAAPNGLVLDAGGLAFIDSAGIAALLQCTERLGPMKVRNPSTILVRLIEISGLETRLEVES